MCTAFFGAVQQAGYQLTDDVNGYRQEGFARFDRNINHGRRWSAARAYLHPVLSRPNLTVLTGTLVRKVVMDGTRAVGVEYSHRRGAAVTVRADEVVLCGGAFNSPQLLQLSGIGNADELRAVGVEPVIDLPGVGENLQDHLEVYVQYASTQPVSLNPLLKRRHMPWIGGEWLLARRGPGASNHFESGGFARSNDEVAYPNLMFHFLPVAVRYDGSAPASDHGYQVHIGPMYSDARGSVKITRPTRPCTRRCGSTTCRPSRTVVSGWRRSTSRARSSSSRPSHRSTAASSRRGRRSRPTRRSSIGWPATARPRFIRRAPARWARSTSVVDPATMRVHGAEGLRVVDASAMPYVTNGNIYAPVMMLAEKSADIIIGREPLPPEPIPFYRHDAATASATATRSEPDR